MKKRPTTLAGLPHFLEPMKARLVASRLPGDWIYEIKFDGYRALVLRGYRETRLLSRNQKDLGKKFPKIVDAIGVLDVQEVSVLQTTPSAASPDFSAGVPGGPSHLRHDPNRVLIWD